jgi:hypothetical protein
MFIPNGFTEQEVLQTIEDVVVKLAGPFKFGFHEAEDMKQEGRILAITALENFDAARGTLKNFLTNHIRNRFINMRRDKLERRHPPCSSCPFYKEAYDRCGAFDCKEDCEKWQGWKKRNMMKRNLMEGYNPNNVSESSGELPVGSDNVLTNMSNQEVVEYVDRNIPVSIRADYLRMLNGVKIPKAKRERILQAVRELVHERFTADE